MKNILLYTLLALLCMGALSSCADDWYAPGSPEAGGELSGSISFDLSTPDMAVATRGVNTKPGASIQVNSLWLGVFDVATGECIGAMKDDNFNTSMVSGNVMKDIVKCDFVSKGSALPLAYIVAVANYDGVTTWNNQPLADLLPDFASRGDINWDKVINIGVDTRSAYRGNKGEEENSTAPFMAGYFQDAVSLTQNPKIDQFAYPGQGPSAIYPSTAAEGMDIQLADAAGEKIYVAAGAICLRRLVAHNTLRFNMKNGYELTGVKYRRCNMPRSVFMLQRRTDTQRRAGFADWQANSPNHADHLLSEGSYNVSDPAFPYESDADWTEVVPDARQTYEDLAIEFEHFENKHWGFGNLSTQGDREALNPDGTFAALCSGAGDAYNNFASYFQLLLHIVNPLTGESADVEYTLHEGFCNTDDGRTASSLAERLKDFGSFRNVNYNYNINIAGLNDITAKVTAEDAAEPDGQRGRIWKMDFAASTEGGLVPTEGGRFNFGGRYMSFGETPDLGFRIVGLDDNSRLVDYCYNMPEGMYEGFAGLWPVGNPVYTDTPDVNIPASLLQGMKVVGPSGAEYTPVEFIKGINGGTLSPTANYSFAFTSYNGKELGLTSNLMRGLYIFDRNDARNGAVGASSYSVVFGAGQYPFNMEAIQFDINDAVVWDDVYYRSITDASYKVFAATKPIFYGAETSSIDLRWRHDTRISGYQISVYNANYTHPLIVVEKDELNKYLHDYNGGKIFIYPLSTAAFPRNTGTGALNYSFSVTPIVDEDMYTLSGNTEVIHNQNGDDATCIRVCPPLYNIYKNGTNDWRDILPVSGIKFKAYLRGLIADTDENVIGTQYNATDYLCYGGAGSMEKRYFSFTASVKGKFVVIVKNHSTTQDNTRMIYIGRIGPDGKSTMTTGQKYDIVYQSNTMPTSKTTFTTPTLQLNADGSPTEFRIYAGGSVDYYTIQFLPE